MSVSIDEKLLNAPNYTVTSILVTKLSINIEQKTIYLNCEISVDGVIEVKVIPIYIYINKFNNMVDIPKLNNIIEGLYGLTIAKTPPVISKYKYIPQALIT
jgi:hypothetical protein